MPGQLKTVLKQVGLVLGVGALIGVLACGNCWDDLRNLFYSVTYSVGLTSAIWFPNGLVHGRLDAFGSWVDKPGRRFVIGLIATVLITVPMIILVNALFFLVLLGQESAQPMAHLFDNLLFALLVTFLIASILHGREFLFAYKEAELRAERLEKERMTARYEALRNQVNPHFLFNSLNALSTLVYKDADLSARFIGRLSKVYRYVLDTRSREVVSLGEELDFVRSYAFLEQIRFGDKLQIEIDPSLDGQAVAESPHLPPLALQLLVENAIKHNEISAAHPLHLSIRREGEALIVENGLRPKSRPDDSPGLGLVNLRSRYAYLTGKPVEISKGQDMFRVSLPLLKMETGPAGDRERENTSMAWSS